MPVRVLIASEQTLFGEALHHLIDHEPDLQVVGQVEGVENVVEQCRRLNADVVLIESPLTRTKRVRAIEQLHARFPEVRVILLATDSEASVAYAIKAGATGCVATTSSVETLLTVIRQVYAGRLHFPVDLTPRIIRYLTQARGDPCEQLSRRERQVLELVVTGLSSRRIAQRLGLSPKNIDTYRSRVMAKVGVPDTIGLVKFAIMQGLIPLEY